MHPSESGRDNLSDPSGVARSLAIDASFARMAKRGVTANRAEMRFGTVEGSSPFTLHHQAQRATRRCLCAYREHSSCQRRGGHAMTGGREIISLIGQRQDLDQFRRKNWEGTFEEYLDIVRAAIRASRATPSSACTT